MWSGRMILMEIMRYISKRVLLASQPSVEYSTLAEISEILLIHKIATYGNTTYVVWQDDTDGIKELFSTGWPPQVEIEKKFTGKAFSTLAPEFFGLSSPKITQLNDSIYFVWSDTSVKDTEDVYFVWSPDNGTTFSAPENLSDTPGNSTEPQIATYGNTTYVVWQDYTNGNNEVYLKSSPAGKSAFGRIFNLSRNIGNSTDRTNSDLWKYHLCGLAG